MSTVLYFFLPAQESQEAVGAEARLGPGEGAQHLEAGLCWASPSACALTTRVSEKWDDNTYSTVL